MSSQRYFPNPYADYSDGDAIQIDKSAIIEQIQQYVANIYEQTWTNVDGMNATNTDPDVYVGDAGIAFMFLRLHQCDVLDTNQRQLSLERASQYIHRAQRSSSSRNGCAFLCGPAGVHAVAGAIAIAGKNDAHRLQAITNYNRGFADCANSKWDEILVGRAGFLSGIHWLNDQHRQNGLPVAFEPSQYQPICEQIIGSGRRYANATESHMPLMYEYHGTKYLGAAHGLSGILQVLLAGDVNAEEVWCASDALVALQDENGDFPTATDSAGRRDRKLVHWCHGAGGVIYLLLQALSRRPLKPEYMAAVRRAADAIWLRGLLKKGPGICHGVAGSGYALLVAFRHTKEQRYLYRAAKMAEFLGDARFVAGARTPDRPHSLYEGLAGTVCFLCDLLEPERAAFPFMEVRV